MSDAIPAIVFTEIPAADPERACKFYETLLQGPLARLDNGPNPIWMFPHAENGHAAGHLYPGQPAKDGNGMTAHFAVRDSLDEAMERVWNGGGEVVSEVIDIPVGSFFYAKDSEGNSLGLFKYNS
ncbi:VOC family protein [Sphingomonas sp. R-74633]|uniref:VOC family protein n=1 Tax=Sphingomonas sp. R-74633 TaxID=2751188 RepID=UPI0015D1675D|nr:VOC family protein [Sphingomonas sp. R-74633]NYT40211.1 VOC family protein [Sphingomonas sp. R-74633]